MASVSVTANASRILHDLLQLTGGIGFTWEYGSHFHERRAHQDARLAGEPQSRGPVARRDRGVGPMTVDVDAYRAEVRGFIAEHGVPMRREGVRVPVDDAEERAFRAWLGVALRGRVPRGRVAGRVGRPLPTTSRCTT